MQVPFTVDQFIAVFRSYNLAVWPMQAVLCALAVAMVLLLATRLHLKSRFISAGLVLLWSWTGIAYHFAFFSTINPSARLFGIFCLLQAGIVLISGVLRSHLAFGGFTGDLRRITGSVLMTYALVIYPILGAVFGHRFPDAPTFGLPCPTTIFTIGLFFFAVPSIRWYLMVIPVVWSMIGGSAAFSMGIVEDIGLLVSGLLLTLLFFKRKSATAAAKIETR
jgi:hypothetical protein